MERAAREVMEAARLRDSVERWLVHESYRFYQTENEENDFTLTVKHAGSFGNRIEVFSPRQQNVVLVVGSLVPLKNSQNARYQRLNHAQRASFAKRVDDYCHSIRAISRTRMEDGKPVFGVYVVLDDEERFNQNDFSEAMIRVAEMGDMVSRFLVKTC